MSYTPNILLVDDEERFIDSLNAILEHYGYDCKKALNGNDALLLLEKHDFNVALLDVGLPDMNGCEIAEYIKSYHDDTTVVMLTGMNTVEIAVEAMKKGAYDFLSKPISHDIMIKTLQKALEHNKLTRELRGSENRFQILAEASWEGIAIHEDEILLEANQQFFRMFGYAEEELLRKNFVKKILNSASLIKSRTKGEYSILGDGELIGTKNNGQEFPIEVQSRVIQFKGRSARVSAIKDISERVKAEQDNLALLQRIAQANKLKALGMMAGSVAHDLSNILTGIVTYPEILLSQMASTDKYFDDIKRIQDAGKRGAAVVGDLIALAREDVAIKVVYNINDIVLSHLGSLEHTERKARYPDIEVTTNLQEDLSNIHCSPSHMHKIFLNLIGNALEAISTQGIIQIATQNCNYSNPYSTNRNHPSTEEFIKISVSDNGPGILPTDLEHIFDPFYSTKDKGKSGTGLGLAIVWNTVENHNGWIEAKDNNPGVIFEVFLPATAEKMDIVDGPVCFKSLKGVGESILLIDDQPEQNEIMERLLGNLGYKIYSVSSGEEGFEFLKTKPVDLVLLDMILGEGINGCETYEKILQINPQQKAIIVSGYSKGNDVVKARRLGVSHFLEKPVTLPVIGQAVKEALCKN